MDDSIYIALLDTPGILAAILHRYLNHKYIHVVLSMDEALEEAYSFGRRNPAIPFFARFETEEKEKILKAFPVADYQVYEVKCTSEQKQKLIAWLYRDYARRRSLHYTLIRLPLIAFCFPFEMKNAFTCSAYAAKLLDESGVWEFEKHYSIVTPRDFAEHSGKRMIYEGSLAELVELYSAGRVCAPE
ncbi:MAG: hypothetical protein LUC90_08135 [Lachnospiraceae bacterium]|nr:hypothetical protein [Lachnospiraceae bacterium]